MNLHGIHQHALFPIKQLHYYSPTGRCLFHFSDSTLVDDSGNCIAVLWPNQALYCAGLEQSLVAEDQLEYNGIEDHSR